MEGVFVSYIDVGFFLGVDINVDGVFEVSMGIVCWDFDWDGVIDIYLIYYFK